MGPNPEEDLLNDVMTFLKHTLAHSVVGIRLLAELVKEVSKNEAKLSPAKQRKIAVRVFHYRCLVFTLMQTAFREKTLLKVFKLGLDSLQRVLQADGQQNGVEAQQQALLKEVFSWLPITHQLT